MTYVRVRERGQITLPKPLRQAAKINTDSPLAVSVIGQMIILSPVRQSSLLTLQKKVKQTAKEKGITLETVLKELKTQRKAFNQRYYGI